MIIQKVTDGIYEAIGWIDGSRYTGYGDTHYEAIKNAISKAINVEDPALR